MPWKPGDEVAEFEDVEAIDETDKSVKCIIPGQEKPMYVAKSHISEDSEVYGKGHKGKLIITQWLAEQAGLV